MDGSDYRSVASRVGAMGRIVMPVGGTSLSNDMTTSSSSDDCRLLARWRGGDRNAGETLIRRYVPALSRFLRLQAPAEAADIVQMTFLALLRGPIGPEEIRDFRAYLLGIGRNQLRMWQRRRAIEQRHAGAHELTARPDSRTLSSQLASRQRATLLAEGLRRLPPDYATAVALFYWEDLSVREIADITGVSPGTVKARLSRARAKLARTLRHRRFSDVALGPGGRPPRHECDCVDGHPRS